MRKHSWKVHKSAFMPCCIGTLFLVPAISSLQANPSQNKTISGVVTSATDSEPLIGVSVQVREPLRVELPTLMAGIR